VCLICGHTVIGDVPDKCPVCAAAKEYYKTF
jgi:rubrerythrin